MTGIVDLPPSGNIALESQGTSALAAPSGQVLGAEAGEGFAHAFPTLELNRALAEETATTGVDPATGLPISALRDAPQLSAEEANQKYGIPGALNFTNPIPDDVAAEMAARKHEELLRQDIIARGEGLPTSGLVRFGAGLAGGLPGIVDPLNIASAFLPVVPEARAVAMGGSLGGRVVLGALQGAAGQAALTPVQALLAGHDQEDYGGIDALLNIAIGGVFGGGLHGLTGGRGDSLISAAPAEAQIAATAEPEIREDMLRSSIAALADDRPVDIPPAIAEQLPAEPPGFFEPAVREGATPFERLPQEPQRLAQYLREQGGLRDDGGELAAMNAEKRPGLVNSQGLGLDEATLRAWQAGFLPGEERPETNALLDALSEDLRGNPQYSDQDAIAVAARNEAVGRNAEIDRYAGELGLPTSGYSREDFWNMVADRMSQQDSARAVVGQDEAFDQAMRQAQTAAGEFVQIGTNSDKFDTGTARTLEEMEAEHAELERTTELGRPSQTAGGQEGGIGGIEQSADAGDRETAVQAGARPRGRGIGARPGEIAEGGARRSGAEPAAAATVADETLDQVDEDNSELAKEIAAATPEGEEPPAELTAELAKIDEDQSQAEDWAKACEQAGMCLGRRA